MRLMTQRGKMNKRLLVVEDNPRLLKMITVCLRQEGFTVAPAASGAEAVAQIAESVPDLIISDIMMPGMSGFALAEYVRKCPRTDLIPIIFLTAKDTKRDRISGFEAGVDAYLTKPFEPDELVAAIKNILERVSRTHARVVRPSSLSETERATVSSSAAAVDAIYVEDLTETERRVAEAVSRGLANKEIAKELGISYRTVEMHVSHILAKRGLSNRVELARIVLENKV